MKEKNWTADVRILYINDLKNRFLATRRHTLTFIQIVDRHKPTRAHTHT